MTVEKNLSLVEKIVLALIVLSALLVLPVFTPPVIMMGSAVAMVGCMVIYQRHNRQSVLVPASLTAGLALLAAVSVFGH